MNKLVIENRSHVYLQEEKKSEWKIFQQEVEYPDDATTHWDYAQRTLSIRDKHGTVLAAFVGVARFFIPESVNLGEIKEADTSYQNYYHQ